MQRTIRENSIMALAVVSALGVSDNASAQIEEITVTAQKVEQSMQDVPVAITAFDEDAVKDFGIETFADLGDLVPNAYMNKGAQAGQALVAIRGVTGATDTLSTAEPGAGLYMNGVYISKNMGALFDMAALERVEVLKGPQGTLFGKNTLGGAINMITRQPSGELGGEIAGSLGSEDLLKGKILLNLPAVGEVGEGVGQLSTLAVINYSENESTMDNSLGGNYGAQEQTGGMLRLLLDVTDSFNVDYIFDYTDTNYSSVPRQLVDAIPASLGFFLLGQDNPERQSSVANNSFTDGNTSEVTGHALTFTWDINDALTLKSITANRESEVSELSDVDGTGSDIFGANTALGNVEALTQELQLIGVGDNYQFLAGLYYFDEEGTDRFNTIFRGSVTPMSAVDSKNEAVAVFGQATWYLSDTWSLTGGLRYTEEDRAVTTSAVPGVDASASFDNFSPMLSIGWAPSDDHNLYLKYSEGWRSGGFNGRARAVAALNPYDEETVASYELGIKSYFLGRMVQMNAALFYNEYQDRQVLTSELQPDGVTIASITSNAGESEMTGLEVELTALATENLELKVNYGYLDSKYTKYSSLDAGGNPIDLKDDNVFTYAPENSLHLGAKYTFEGFSWGVATARIDYSWKDEYYTERLVVSQDIATQKSVGTLNARIDVAEIPVGNGNLRASLWGKNLTDEDVKLFSIDLRNSLGWAVARWDDHATYGFDISYSF